jgi:hypothetical protein
LGEDCRALAAGLAYLLALKHAPLSFVLCRDIMTVCFELTVSRKDIANYARQAVWMTQSTHIYHSLQASECKSLA